MPAPPGYGGQPGYGGPPSYGPPPGYGYGPPPRRANWALRIVLILLLLVGLGAGGLAIAYFGGFVTSEQLLNVIGQGPASIEIDNLRDVPVSARLEGLGEDGSTSSTDLQPLEVQTLSTDGPGAHLLVIDALDAGELVRCNLDVGGGDHWQFVLVERGAIVLRNDQQPSDPDDLLADRSSLCR